MPSRTQRQPRNTPANERVAQRIGTLKTRDPVKIWQVYGTLEVEDCTLSFTRALLDNLKEDFYPEVPEDPLNPVTDDIQRCAIAAIASLSLLNKLMAIGEVHPHLLRDTAALFVESLDLIVHWAGIALGLRAPLSNVTNLGDVNGCCLEICGLFHGLMAMDGSIHSALISSTAFIRLLFDIWIEPVPRDGREGYCLLWHLPARCPAVWLLREIAASAEGKQAFLEGLVFHEHGETFAAATIGRMRQIREEVAKANCADGFEIYMADYFIPVIQDFGLPSDSRVAPYFRKLQYITLLTKTSNQISVSLVKDGMMPRKQAGNIMVILVRLIRIALLEDPYMMRSFGYLVEGAYLEMLARTIVKGYAGDTAHDDVMSALQALDFIGVWTVYPAMGKRLVRARLSLHPDMVIVESLPHIGESWKTFWRVILDRGVLYMQLEGTDYLKICDNISCGHTANEEHYPSRQCSGCSSVMYCSELCQRADWDAFHRAECSDARAHYLKQKEAGTSYSHRSRAFQARYIEKRYRDHARAIADAVEDGRAMTTFYPLLNCGSLEEPMTLLGINDSPKESWLSRPDTRFVQSYLEPRLTSLVEAYASGMMASDFRLAEAVFGHGPSSEVSVLVLLRVAGDGPCQAIYSVARIK